MNDPSDSICIAEFLEIRSSTEITEIVRGLQSLGLSEFENGQDQNLHWARSSDHGIETFVSQFRSTTDDLLGSNDRDAIYLTVFVRRSSAHYDDLKWSGQVLVPRIAQFLANRLSCRVVHFTTWWHARTMKTDWNRVYQSQGRLQESDESRNPLKISPTAPNGWGEVARITTVDACRPIYDGPLDFAFVVHPRSFDEKIKPFPELRRLSKDLVEEFQTPCIVISWIEAEIDGQVLRGELLTIPYTPHELIERLPSARESIQKVIDYAASRQTRIVGLGALLPSITRQGRLLNDYGMLTGVTTGHGFTALAISQFVRKIEEATGVVGPVAVIGAAGSTGRASVRCLVNDRPTRPLICIDLPQQLKAIPQPKGWDPAIHHVTIDRSEIKKASIVVCVTNALGNILHAEDFGPDAVILDDAQPENVSASVVVERPDLTVIKCLASIPGLRCPFDLGLFANGNVQSNISFTCLAETVLLAIAKHQGSFVVGDPTDAQLDFLRIQSQKFSIETAPFLSFPQFGTVKLTRRG
jgi:predicted amino acid dehydrogenase